ncbi:hypothetical protein NPA07_04110 [Mycoplasmopsis caviae]|uniref:Uncharacterized protein n=1 Tax=Mycoplasmopsis caviae TaxID=55603 RepID=A0ABY5IY00_9BACT|nr:hypothetical protein [Mycoplasmopsis caviae]UUD34965.1 hypothetical protein NPA07_04110 [Mycoplasmopsis caviae]
MNLVIKRKIVNHTVRYDNKYLAPFDNNGARVSMFESGEAKLMVTPENKLFFVEGKENMKPEYRKETNWVQSMYMQYQKSWSTTSRCKSYN